MSQQPQTAAILHVRVQPRASRNEVVGYQGEVLRVRVTAPPEDGRSNDAVVALLAESLGVPKSRVRILRGHASRNKVVSVESLSLEEATRRLEAL
ncbi:MAG: DUF167 domain-containing protein [Dehalococcoidia bacterium]|nr:DUF167 domain-containing protein [Dehalococcoidia bacterium]MSQ16416.1 DUF167 domain-containing protein [Dehalococcoidia bacterium]